MKRSLIAFIIAILLPLAGYFFVKYYSKDSVHLPGKYFHDSVIIKNKVNDTIWHQVKSIPFYNQLGNKISFNDAKGKILVVNFFFTRCPVVCPTLTRNMKKLQDAFVKNADIVQFISISVDPEHDSVPVLRKYADKYNVNHDSWWMVTGNKEQIYDFSINEMKANIADPKVDTAFIHTEDFFLLDTNRVIRGWYNGFDTTEQSNLAKAIPTLMLERDRKRPSILRNFIPYLPAIFLGIGLIIFFVTFISWNKKKRENV